MAPILAKDAAQRLVTADAVMQPLDSWLSARWRGSRAGAGTLAPMSRPRHLACIAVVVDEYDRAIDHYTRDLGFELIEDTPLEGDKRWVLVAPSRRAETRILLARAATPAQREAIGNQSGGRVFLFLRTASFDDDLARMKARGVEITDGPRTERYGRVAVFRDRYGNRWDLLEDTTA